MINEPNDNLVDVMNEALEYLNNKNLIDVPGIFFDLDPAAYFRDPCPAPSVTQSLLKLLLDQTPLHARFAHPRLTPTPAELEDYRKDRAIGTAVHLLLLGRGKRLAIGKFPDWKTKVARDFRDDAFAAGLTPIIEAHAGTAHQIVQAAMTQLVARGLAGAVRGEGGHSEVVLAWIEVADFWCRTMLDRLTDASRHVIDIKTTGTSAAPHAVGNMVADWAIQSAMHERGLNVIDPNNAGRRRYTYVVIEQYEPYALAAYDLPESVLHYGRTMLQMGLEIWGECMRTERWPAYPIEVLTPTLPPWIENRMLERQMERRDRTQAPTWDTLAEKEMDLGNKFDRLMAG